MQLIAAGLLFWSALLVELCWLGAWGTFIWAFVPRTFPLPDMLAGAGVAALFGGTTAGQRLRNVHVLALHVACATAFWLFELQRHDGAVSLLLALTTVVFWTSGMLHARRTLTHRVVCARFDLGMYWLLALLGLRLLLRGQAQVPQQAAPIDVLVPSFFINALCAICVARYRSQVSKQWLRVSGRIVMLFSGAAALGAFAFSIVWLCRPYLRTLAETSHKGAAAVARPIANAAAEVLFAVMREGAKHPMPMYLPGHLPLPYPGRGQLTGEPLEAVNVDEGALTVVCVVACMLALIAALFCVWWKRNWLLARQSEGSPANELWAFCQQLWRWLRGLRANPEAEPVRLMNALLAWGERSGITRGDAETPVEYARRLKLSFAAMSGEIDSIVHCHCQQTYALRRCDQQQIEEACRALRQLRSPRRWWARTCTRWRAMHTRQRSAVA
ncbi:MAG TPA: DUF4129 domain-containing protein [Polyangiales bacterium]|nr:DUF4129 domain-containing protein [Polyangiales bacterium]